MLSCISDPGKPLPSVRIVCVVALTLLLSGWTTCSAMFAFNSCESSTPQPQITSLSPATIPGNAEPTVLSVNGSNFAAQSQIMWNGTALPTMFINSRLLQTTITEQTVASFGGSAGSTVQISVMSTGPATVAGCPNGGSSSTLVLVIN
ncbi:MAG: hypothetical protein LAO24_14370 [Acidobacteriia bacterium]|nr:hypothetical protein [Terriglobia bacterium]